MAEDIVAGTTWSESEFLPVEVHFGKCGGNALAMADSWSNQHYRSTTAVYNDMRAANRCDVSGASNLGGIVAQTHAYGHTYSVLLYSNPMPAQSWRAFFDLHHDAAIVFEPSHGQALVDALTGKGEDASNLAFHWATKLGRNTGGHSPRANRTLPSGYWVADGDNYVNNTWTPHGMDRHLGGHTLCYYDDAVLTASKPVCAVAIYAKVGAPVSGVPAGWHDSANGNISDPVVNRTAVLTASNSIPVTQAMRVTVLGSTWDPKNVPLEAKHYVGTTAFQMFRDLQLVYTAATGTYMGPVGQDCLAALNQVNVLSAQVLGLQAQLQACQAAGGGSGNAALDTQAVLAMQAAIADHVKKTQLGGK